MPRGSGPNREPRGRRRGSGRRSPAAGLDHRARLQAVLQPPRRDVRVHAHHVAGLVEPDQVEREAHRERVHRAAARDVQRQSSQACSSSFARPFIREARVCASATRSPPGRSRPGRPSSRGQGSADAELAARGASGSALGFGVGRRRCSSTRRSCRSCHSARASRPACAAAARGRSCAARACACSALASRLAAALGVRHRGLVGARGARALAREVVLLPRRRSRDRASPRAAASPSRSPSPAPASPTAWPSSAAGCGVEAGFGVPDDPPSSTVLSSTTRPIPTAAYSATSRTGCTRRAARPRRGLGRRPGGAGSPRRPTCA